MTDRAALRRILLCGAVLTMVPGAASPAPPTGPAQIARLLFRAEDPETVPLWSSALGDPRPSVRATAARMAWAAGPPSMAAAIQAALSVETDLAAAREEIRALARLGGRSAETALLAAAERLGPFAKEVVAESLVRSGGLEALARNFPYLRHLDHAGGWTEWLVRVTTRSDSDRAARLARAVLGKQDAGLWSALLDAASRDDLTLDPGLLLTGLTSASGPIRARTAWHLARAFATAPPADARSWLTALEDGEDPAAPAGRDIDRAFGRTLLARALGREPVTDAAWIEFLKSDSLSHVDIPGVLDEIDALLTRPERRAAGKRIRRRSPRRDKTRRRLSSDPPPPERTVRTIGTVPPGLLEDLISATACDVPSGRPVFLSAGVTFDDQDRPARIVLQSEPAHAGCRELVTLLFAMSPPPPDHVPLPGREETLILGLERGFLANLQQRRLSHWPSFLPDEEDPGLEFPRRIQFVKPEYPPEAFDRHLGGKVIVVCTVNRDGNVEDITIKRVDEPMFLEPAVWAISQWKYQPATYEGTTVAVHLTMIVEFEVR